jgi:hypothetical protein
LRDLNAGAILVEVRLALDEELVDAGQGNVQLHQLLVLVEQAVEALVEVEAQLSCLVLPVRLSQLSFQLYEHALYRKSDLSIPRNKTARPPSQFLFVSNSCISMVGLPIWLQQNRQTNPRNI